MSANHQLTLLQHGVIRRLRAAGRVDLAHRARTQWARGEPVAELPRDEQHGLRAGEFIRANEQAERIGRELTS